MLKMAGILSLMIIAQCILFAADDDTNPTIYPQIIEKCLKNPRASTLEIATGTNPVYLRGDFDGDSKPDYALAVRGNKTRRLGILICDAKGRMFIVGADNPLQPPFSDMPKDLFFAPNWHVLSRAETLELGQFTLNVPHPLPKILAETMAMIWEDGIALIYWDGQRYRWAGAAQ